MSKDKNAVRYRKDGTRVQTFGRILRNNFVMVLKIAKYSPHVVIACILQSVITGLRGSASAIFTVKLFDGLDNGESLPVLLTYIAIYALWLSFATAFGKLNGYIYTPWAKQKLDIKINTELFNKVRTMDEACFDDPEFYDDYVWALNQTCGQAEGVMNSLKNVISPVITFSSLVAVMLTLEPLMAVVLGLLAISKIFVVIAGNNHSYKYEKKYNTLWRLRNYIRRVYFRQDRAKEIRTSHVSELLIREHTKNTEEYAKVGRESGTKYFLIYTLCDGLVSDLGYYFILIYMIFRMNSGLLLIGGFAAAVNMLWKIQYCLYDLIYAVGEFPKHSIFLERYYAFLENEPRVRNGKESVPEPGSIEIRNVSFSYDFTQNMHFDLHEKDWVKPENEHSGYDALKDVSLTVKKGEKIAIVGYNGAGKTTLIKLIMRLYDPVSGQILLNGRDIREFDLEEYRSKIGVVFQDYKIFAASIAENVMKGNYNPETDKEKVLKALESAGFTEKLESLSEGVDTMLTKEFDKKGTNLSGGEGQKIAIARVFAHPYDIIIMDEPSSALDPIAEYEVNQEILKYAEGKTVIFISHRLSTTRMADRIYMFDSGSLIETGSHDELMKLNGKYAEIFKLQAEKYQ